jgi:hypothetical protein
VAVRPLSFRFNFGDGLAMAVFLVSHRASLNCAAAWTRAHIVVFRAALRGLPQKACNTRYKYACTHHCFIACRCPSPAVPQTGSKEVVSLSPKD